MFELQKEGWSIIILKTNVHTQLKMEYNESIFSLIFMGFGYHDDFDVLYHYSYDSRERK